MNIEKNVSKTLSPPETLFERKRIVDICTTSEGIVGHIILDKLAIPETVKVTLLGEPIIPQSFDIFGHPSFTKEQYRLYMFKEDELKRNSKESHFHLEAEITYKERIFDVPRSTFDTIEGIRNSLNSISDFQEMLLNRRLFCKSHPGENLKQFILFGGYCSLDSFGQHISLDIKEKDKLEIKGNVVETYEAFFKKHNFESSVFGCSFNIPYIDSICPCCGKPFTIDDIKNKQCIGIDGKFYHDNCWHNYRKLTEVDKFTRLLMDSVYKTSDYHFELLPNGFSKEDKYSYIPWILFHTIDGDIIIGCYDDNISIEWQENYKPFNINLIKSNLCNLSDDQKWIKDGKRGIYASSFEDALICLNRVLYLVNPEYSWSPD